MPILKAGMPFWLEVFHAELMLTSLFYILGLVLYSHSAQLNYHNQFKMKESP